MFRLCFSNLKKNKQQIHFVYFHPVRVRVRVCDRVRVRARVCVRVRVGVCVRVRVRVTK